MTATHNLDFEVDRNDLAATRVVRAKLPPLASGQVRFRIDRFALTANNVSYAVTGDQLDYWGFFPAAEGWGRIPAMGWADVAESEHPEVAVGERYYGWYPMSRYLTVDAEPNASGLVDGAHHRARHAKVYRSYVAADRDPLYDPDHEDRHALLRGLFATAFLAEDFFFDQDFYGATTSIVLSASSKTAIGFAAQAHARSRGPVVGVTSAGNVAFVEGLGAYHQVVDYDRIEAIATEGDALLVDMSGNGEVVRRVHRHLGPRLRYSMSIGASHWRADRASDDLPGPKPTFFFAPTQAGKRLQEWGPEGYARRIAVALKRFVEASGSWLDVEHAHGPDAVAAIYQRLLAGEVPPRLGQIASLHE